MRWPSLLLIVGCSYEPPLGQPDTATDAPGDTTPGDATSMDTATDAPLEAIDCPGSMCGSVCCEGDCINAASVCTGNVFRCDGPEDCGIGEVCCNDQNGSTCVTGTCGGYEACHTTSDCSFTCNDCSFSADHGQRVCCE